MYLSKADILGKRDLRRVEIDIPEWGGMVIVQEMNPAERGLYEASTEKDPPEIQRAWMVALTVIDADGNRLFSSDDVRALAGKSPRAMNRIWEVAAKMAAEDVALEINMAARLEKAIPRPPSAESLADTAESNLREAMGA